MAQKTDSVSLGKSPVRVSRLGVGTNFWGSNRKADLELRPVFDKALELGINFFDTAEVYGFGAAERTLGLFLPAVGEQAVVATKFFPMPYRLGKLTLAAALRASLERLQLERVDLYLIHFPIPPVAIEVWMEALAEAIEAGLTRAVGVSNYNPEQMARAHAALSRRGIPLACNQVEYSLLKRGPERSGLLSMCRELDVALVAYRPVASGLLAGKYSLESPPLGWRGRLYNHRLLERLQPLVGLLRRIGGAHESKTPSQVALNWLICKGALPIPGATKAAHMQENAGALGWRLSEAEVSELDRVSSNL
jgi:aryl-alcohol dehydrogenase-like predicted oxidoreductase